MSKRKQAARKQIATNKLGSKIATFSKRMHVPTPTCISAKAAASIKRTGAQLSCRTVASWGPIATPPQRKSKRLRERHSVCEFQGCTRSRGPEAEPAKRCHGCSCHAPNVLAPIDNPESCWNCSKPLCKLVVPRSAVACRVSLCRASDVRPRACPGACTCHSTHSLSQRGQAPGTGFASHAINEAESCAQRCSILKVPRPLLMVEQEAAAMKLQHTMQVCHMRPAPQLHPVARQSRQAIQLHQATRCRVVVARRR